MTVVIFCLSILSLVLFPYVPSGDEGNEASLHSESKYKTSPETSIVQALVDSPITLILRPFMHLGRSRCQSDIKKCKCNLLLFRTSKLALKSNYFNTYSPTVQNV